MELMSVVVLIIVLVAIVVPTYLAYTERRTDNMSQPDAQDADAMADIRKRVIAMTKELSSAKPHGSKSNRTMAKSLHKQGIKYGNKGDPESVKRAIVYLHKSLSYQYSRETLIDMAHYFSCLGYSGVNVELNFIRSNGILDGLQISKKDKPQDYVESSSVRIINYARMGDLEKARRQFSKLNDFMSGEHEGTKKNERFLEARYFMESDWPTRLSIAEELIRSSPGNPKYYDYKGIACYHTHEHELARQCFERAVAMNKEYSPVVANMKSIRQNQAPRLLVMPNLKQGWESEPDDMPYSALSILSRQIVMKMPPWATLCVKAELDEAEIRILNTGDNQQDMIANNVIGAPESATIDPGNLHITIFEQLIKTGFVENRTEGRLFVIRGKVRNDYAEVRNFIMVRGVLYSQDGKAVQEKTVYCGNTLSDADLQALDRSTMHTRLRNRFGDEKSNFRIPSGKVIPFVVVFSGLPQDLGEFSVEVVSSSPG